MTIPLLQCGTHNSTLKTNNDDWITENKAVSVLHSIFDVPMQTRPQP